MKKRIFLIIIFCALMIAYFVLRENSRNYNEFELYDLPTEAIEICSNNKYVFYIINKIDTINILKCDIVSKNKEILYTYDSVTDDFTINELSATNDDLFWVENSKDFKCKIIKYDLENKTSEALYSYEQSGGSIIPICLGVGNNFIAWYEAMYSEDEGLNEYLIIYNVISKKSIIKNVFLFGNPFLRPYIRNNYISYIVKEKDNYFIEIYNILDNKEKKIECTTKVAKLMSNDKYAVWLDDYEMRNIYIYDIRNEKYRKIDGSEDIFTIMLIDEELYISYTKDKDGFTNIYSVNLENNVIENITNNKDMNNSYYLCKLNINNKLLYEKNNNGKIIVFLER